MRYEMAIPGFILEGFSGLIAILQWEWLDVFWWDGPMSLKSVGLDTQNIQCINFQPPRKRKAQSPVHNCSKEYSSQCLCTRGKDAQH